MEGESLRETEAGPFPWLALLLGLAFGLGAGLVLTWEIWPVQYYDTDPVDLKPELKEDYLLLVSAAYALDGNLERAEGRLDALGEEEAGRVLADLAERYSQEGREVSAIRSLAKLAYALGARRSVVLIYIATPTATPTSTPTPPPPPQPFLTPTPTPLAPGLPTATPTITPTVTPAPTYHLWRKMQLCEKGPGRILVYVQDEKGLGVPGVEVQVSWPGGLDSFFTGLKPELDLGYADFEMSPGLSYAVSIVGSELEVEGLQTGQPGEESCSPEEEGGENVSWQLVFQRSY